MSVLVFVEVKSGKLKKTSCELVSHGVKIASQLSTSLKAVVIGESVKGVANEAASYGATEVYVADNPSFLNYNVERFTSVLEEAVKKSDATILLATASATGKDLLPRLAARLKTGMMTECTDLKVAGGKIVGTRPIYAGKVFVDVTIPEGKPQIATLRPNSFEVAKPDTGKTATVTEVGAQAASMTVKARIVEMIAAKSDKPDLTEASVIVSGGRSLKSAENFKILQDLADVLGAAVGASRAAVDAGYVPHSMQVGQTGKTVNPTLYIAAGISGAIQHLAGMRTSKVIVAINSDPEAPIFQVANYGIVGDLFQVVPLMTEEFKKLLKE